MLALAWRQERKGGIPPFSVFYSVQPFNGLDDAD